MQTGRACRRTWTWWCVSSEVSHCLPTLMSVLHSPTSRPRKSHVSTIICMGMSLDNGAQCKLSQLINTGEIKRTLFNWMETGQNCTDFQGSPLFQATYNIKTKKNKQLNQLVSVGCGRLAEGKGTKLTDEIKKRA